MMPSINFLRYSLIGLLNWFMLSTSMAQTAHPQFVYQSALSGDQRVLAVIYGEYGATTVDFFDTASGQLLRTGDLSPLRPSQIALSPTGDRLLFSDAAGDHLAIYDVNIGITVILQEFDAISVGIIGWNPVKDEIAYTLGSGVTVLDAATGSWLYHIAAGDANIVYLAWSLDGTRLATSHFAENPFTSDLGATATRIVKVWDLSNTQNRLTVPSFVIQDRGGGELAWSPDCTRLAMTEDQRLLVYNLDLDQMETDLPVDDDYFNQLEWNRNGNLLATGGSLIRVWDTDTWQVVRTIELDKPVSNLQWSFDGKHLFSDGGTDGLYWDDIPMSQLTATPIG
jgi:WD40 repeat protein